jgi:hypothetical protein
LASIIKGTPYLIIAKLTGTKRIEGTPYLIISELTGIEGTPYLIGQNALLGMVSP